MSQTTDRKEYQRAYYLATKEAKKAKRKKQPRTPSMIASEKRYREKKQLIQEIQQMPHGPVWGCGA